MSLGASVETITILRRPTTSGGEPRGDFATAFTTAAGWRVMGGQRAIEFGLAQDETAITLRVWDCAQNRTITLADRLIFKGDNYEILSANPPSRITGTIDVSAKRRMGA